MLEFELGSQPNAMQGSHCLNLNRKSATCHAGISLLEFELGSQPNAMQGSHCLNLN